MYTNKAGKAGLSVREGSATFFRSCRFSLLDQRSLTLKHLFPAEVGGWAGGQAVEWVGPAGTYLASDADLCSHTSSLHRQLIILPRLPAGPPACLPCCPQPGAQAKYGGVFAAMLRSSPALQMALQRVATVAQLRQASPPALASSTVSGLLWLLLPCAGHIAQYGLLHAKTPPLHPRPLSFPLQPAGASAAG